MPLLGSGKHVKRSLSKTISAMMTAVSLIAAGVLAFAGASQAATETKTIYCSSETSTFSVNYLGANPDLEGAQGVELPVNDFSYALISAAQGGSNVEILFDNSDTVTATTVYYYDDGDPRIVIEWEGSLTMSSADVWPLNVSADFSYGNYKEDIVNPEATFIEFSPCAAWINDGETENTNDAFDANAGEITALSTGYNWLNIGADQVTKTTYDSGLVEFEFTAEDFYSLDSDGLVDIEVKVSFSGNSVRWDVEAFDAGTSTPADLSFKILSELGSDTATTFHRSNGYTYSDDGYDEDPVLIYGSSGVIESTNGDDIVAVTFADSGHFEITMLGYDFCATDEQINTAISNFTSNYGSLFGTDLADVDGTCTSACAASASAIEVSSGNFDLSGVDLCFEQGYDSPDPLTPLNQVTEDGDDLGNNLLENEYVVFESVAEGSDKTLDALITISDINLLEDDEVDEVDNFEKPIGSVNTSITYQDVTDNPVDRGATYTLIFYEAGDSSKTPVAVSGLELNIYDIDHRQFFEADNVSTYTLSSDTTLSTTLSRAGQIRAYDAEDNSSDSGDESRLSLKFKTSSLFTLSMGVIAANPDFGGASYQLDFTSGPAWVDEPVETPASNYGAPPSQRPDAPTKPRVTITPGEGSLNVQVLYDGLKAKRPQMYTATAYPGGNSCVAYGANSSCEITGLASGTAYTVRIVAENSVGRSGKYVTDQKFTPLGSVQSALVAKRTIDKFNGGSPILLKALKKKIKRFIANHPTLASFTCTGYTAGPVTASDKVLARTRAFNVCAYIEKIKPAVSTTTIGKTPGLPLGAANRKVVIRGYSD